MASGRVQAWLWLACIFACVGLINGRTQSKSATISLKAKWDATPALLEAAEFLAEEDPSLLWSFVEQWHTHGKEAPEASCWDRIGLVARGLIPPPLATVLQVSLGVREYSPRLELLRKEAEAAGIPEGSCAFVDFGSGRKVSRVEDLGTALKATPSLVSDVPPLYDFDHVFPSGGGKSEAPQATAVLYGAIGTEAFWQLHDALAEASKAGAVRYVFRPVLLPGCSTGSDDCAAFGTGDRLRLPGFGVGMAIKNMEYSALDDKKVAGEAPPGEAPLEEVAGFNFQTLVQRQPDLRQQLLEFQDHLLASSSSDEALKVWDLKDLGLQAAQRICSASDPLRSLSDISQNFPNLAAVLSRTAVSKELRAELRRNQAVLPSGATFTMVNGLFLDPESDLFELLGRLRKEVRLAERLKESRLEDSLSRTLLALRAKGGAQDANAQDLRLDLFTAEQILFVTDVETDPRFRSWSRSLTGLLQPMYPGHLPRVARNLLTLVLVIDPTTTEGLRLARYARDIAGAGQLPLRVGILIASSKQTDESAPEAEEALAWDTASASRKAALLFHLLAKEEGAYEALSFLASIESPLDGLEVGSSAVETGFEHAMRNLDLTITLAEASSQVEGAVAQRAADSAAFVRNAGLDGLPNSMWLNGAVLPARAPTPQARLSYGMQHEIQRLQELVYFGTLEDSETDIPAFLSRHFGAVPRHNPLITDAGREEAPQLALTGRLRPSDASPLGTLGYLHRPGTEDAMKPITHWLAVDLANEGGRSLLREALLFLRDSSSSQSRLGILQHSVGAGAVCSRVVAAANRLPARRSKLPDFFLSLLNADCDTIDRQQALDLAESAGLNRKALARFLDDDETVTADLAAQKSTCRSDLGLQEGAAAVITNGRIVTSRSSTVAEHLCAADFLLLNHHAATSQLALKVSDVIEAAMAVGKPVLRSVTGIEGSESDDNDGEDATSEQLSDAAMVASSVLADHLAKDPHKVQGQVEKVVQAIGALEIGSTGFVLPGRDGSSLQLTLVIDPLSKDAQQWAAILDFLRSTLQPSIRVHLTPARDLSTLPLTSFYRMAVPEFSLRGDGLLEAPGLPAAHFESLPASKVLTLHMDVPEAWLVEPVKAAHDLDNLRLGDLATEGLRAEFELEALLLTGSCTDAAARTREQVTPRGVQLHLGNGTQPHVVDTLVMSNLGYFQLKAGPGVHSLRLAPGRSQELYTVIQAEASPELQEGSKEAVSLPVVIDSFQGRHQRLRLRKRPGYETADVLEEPETGGLLQGVTSWFGGSSSKDATASKGGRLAPEDDPDTIHIFTIASGHMYERLQKIMILSLIRNTRNRVKVWFIKNYMSPQMKRFLPHMAEQYGFDYEFVTYKWPAWLHKQTDKQRIIWAYKILFLDVLFPLNLRKVIFVDSDQIMRADFKELWNMDLKGAPLAYTPFCDNNRDMDGFRFWKQGFWQEHLRGRPYHISALYVVDLARFRQMAAGDNLRIVYEQLSRDPNSLSNLDQDLPNYAQHGVPIHSLPQEWLWCETWCGNETKPAAKTIDLCNNPLTKEPKLQGARRIVAEWPALDAEAQAFTAKVEEELSRQAREAGSQGDLETLSLSSGTQEQLLAGTPAEEVAEDASAGDQQSPSQPHDASEL